MKVSKEKISEWKENPVTLALKALVEDELAESKELSPSDCITRGDPQKTQENLVEIAAKELELQAFVDFLDGDWSELVEDEDENSEEID